MILSTNLGLFEGFFMDTKQTLNQKPRIVWMMDETIANSCPRDWNRVTALETALLQKIANPEFQHQIVSPIPCLNNLARQLKDSKFSCIFDLTGWLRPALHELFPRTPIVDDFSLSRVRRVSDPELKTTGYTVSMTPEEIRERKSELDLSKALIIDDVTFSGWTGRKTMEEWNLNPEETTHGYLIANTGDLGPKPGAVKMLESLGCTVKFGFEIHTPQDDGWHLKDLHVHPNLQEAFHVALGIQQIFKNLGKDSHEAQALFKNELFIRAIFPGFLTSENIHDMLQEGKFISLNGLHDEEIHAKNPFLWASPYFLAHVDVDRIFEQREGILGILRELHQLTTDPEGKREASIELRKEIHKSIHGDDIEGFMLGKERL